ncbi:type II secretion system F family protein [Phycicoccus sp. KQZ13P-1]|uniref:type II secretion system F family protein n=1 Tax=Phycicoccus mangrovi TaxID=2840470 RepID=UPI001BFFFFFC|nr:type II secretion system F family protein [Phycicoccus mangrovi]MBT9257692.1 type II secretion system F family protein [Phycicoccus mangrovi]
MTTLLPVVLGAAIVLGTVGAVLALRPHTPRPRAERTPSKLGTRLASLPRRTRITLGAAVAAGLLVALVTGWVVAVVVLPVAALVLPYLLSAPPAAAQIRRVEAMEEWTRSLAGVLGAGIGLEQALTATLRSTPEPIKPEVTTLVARLRARWDTEEALRAFAEDLDDVTGDLVAANLILAARRRNRSLASALQGVAESVAEDVASRRKIEAGRAKPRGSARLVTLFSLGVLVVLAFTGDYVEPYTTPIGEVVLVFLLLAYAGALFWMRKMAEGKPLPRFLGAHAKAEAR